MVFFSGLGFIGLWDVGFGVLGFRAKGPCSHLIGPCKGSFKGSIGVL